LPLSKPNDNSSAGLFKVAYSELVRTAAKDLLQRAKAKGVLSEVTAAMRAIDQHLHRDPTTFGEPHKNLVHGQGQIRTGFVRPLAVVFSVYEEDRTVLVTRPLMPLSELGL